VPSRVGLGILHPITFRLAESQKALYLPQHEERVSPRQRAHVLLSGRGALGLGPANSCATAVGRKTFSTHRSSNRFNAYSSLGSNSCYCNPDLRPRWLRPRPPPERHLCHPNPEGRGRAPWYPSTRLSFSLVTHTRSATTTVDVAETRRVMQDSGASSVFGADRFGG